MKRTLVRGIEGTDHGDRLVIRNTGGCQTLGGHCLLAIAAGFCGCCGFLGLAVPYETPRERGICVALRMPTPSYDSPLVRVHAS
jgi:hypothetical protein